MRLSDSFQLLSAYEKESLSTSPDYQASALHEEQFDSRITFIYSL